MFLDPDADRVAAAPVARRRVAPLGYVAVHVVLVPALLGAGAWLLQHRSVDLALSALVYDRAHHVFVGDGSLLLELLGHQAGRGVAGLAVVVALGAALATAVVPSLAHWRRVALALALALLLTPTIIAWLRLHTAAHCPQALDVFGGFIDYRAERDGPFWSSSVGAGRCLPSGHAGGGFALLASYFAGWASGRPRWRWLGLLAGVAAGTGFAAVRIAQGAQLGSQTLWSAFVAWTTAALVFAPLLIGGGRGGAREATA